MTALARYGARLITIDGRAAVEMVDPNDNCQSRHQYRRTLSGGLEHRVLSAAGAASDWETCPAERLAVMAAQRGRYHPILDPLGLDIRAVLAALAVAP